MDLGARNMKSVKRHKDTNKTKNQQASRWGNNKTLERAQLAEGAGDVGSTRD